MLGASEKNLSVAEPKLSQSPSRKLIELDLTTDEPKLILPEQQTPLEK